MLGNESSMLILMLRTKVPGAESSWGWMFQGTKVQRNESSTYGTFISGNDSSWVWKFQLPFRSFL